MAANGAWTFIGTAGATLFYSRFLIQWYASEREGRSVIPVSFWYLSSAGTLMLLMYALAIRSPLGALGQCFNIVVYSRNLVHIGRKHGALGARGSAAVQVIAGVVATLSIALALRLWLQELDLYPGHESDASRASHFWLALGLVGQVLFACRFLVQWIATERRGECTVPASFWYLSVVASVFQVACFGQRGEWIFAVGMAVTVVIYLRNIALLGAENAGEQTA